MQYLQQPSNVRNVSKDTTDFFRQRSVDESPSSRAMAAFKKAISPRGEIINSAELDDKEDKQMFETQSKAPAVPAAMFKPNSIKMMNDMMMQKYRTEQLRRDSSGSMG